MAKMILANPKKVTLLTQKINYLNNLRYLLFTAVSGGVITGDTAYIDFVFVDDTNHPLAGKAPTFGTAYLNPAKQAQTDSPPLSWTFAYNKAVPFTIQGYVAIDYLDNKVVLSQFAPVPVQINAPGQTYTVTPLMLDDTMP